MSITEQSIGSKSSSRGRLLVVEDQRSNRELIADILESEGYEVLTAEDGLDALDQLVKILPDGIISDLTMPRMSGFEFLEVVRQRFPYIPVLVISGEFEGHNRPAGILADAYLEKGAFSFNQLRSTISELLSSPPRKQPVIGFVTANASER
jgi:CheY-like chemotaxis protein